MFDKLTGALQDLFRKWRGVGKLSERNVQDALREVRLTLLEADVHYQVARDFIGRVKEKALGREVLDSITPGQQMIKIVHDELVVLLGGAHRDFDFSGRPASVLLLGLHGAGKTTTAAKLARLWKKKEKKVLLVACDLRRPAAVDQLRILAGQAEALFFPPRPGEALPDLGRRALEQAGRDACDVVLFDTGGRFQMDAELVAEVRELREAVRPGNVVLVLDAAIGQESVHVAETFHKEVGLTGLILTKLDGDARGGAALSVHAVTGCPILVTGTGEQLDNLEPFYPDRMASRILGMGDVVSLVEKAQQAVDVKEMQKMQERLLEDRFTLEDFLEQIQQVKRLGPVENLLEMMPGAGMLRGRVRPEQAGQVAAEWKKAEAILRSMTPGERRNPDILDAGRRRRIALGSGTAVQDVNAVLQQYEQARRMTRQFKHMQKRLLRKGR
ncbi:MAG: signal recognition particle protein [Verrucomicrobia bacterium]|nr:signal recognition particle protein [Verrucomicrobiota bacterium]MBU1910670.1 signal recognition particle protein [Verrucomicrobiota bacterium]